MKKVVLILFILALCLSAIAVAQAGPYLTPLELKPPGQMIVNMAEYHNWYFLSDSQRSQDVHNIKHFFDYGADAPNYNKAVLQGIDKVMATAPNGGGYFVGLRANPPESPLGYDLKFGKYSLLTPPRSTSYCSGSSYGVFIEALNIINPRYSNRMTAAQLEACRMQEPDGGRRDDDIKLWGYWNDDVWGIHHALIDYTQMGEVVAPYAAKPGDFIKIMWSKSSGHFVVFLGWVRGANNQPVAIRYWSSQPGTNGFGEQESSISKIYSILFVRLTYPDNITKFDPDYKVNIWNVMDAGYVLK
ncbi:MAG: hypothetical protein WCV63_03560 [Negativicutes bacterium]